MEANPADDGAETLDTPETTSPPRRVCRALACEVNLSRYNPGELCGVHTPPDYRLPPAQSRRA